MFAVRRDELVAVHVAADEPRAVREAVREPRVRRQQQQVRAPAVARRDARTSSRDTRSARRADPGATPCAATMVGRCLVEHQPPDQRAIVQHDLLRRHQLAEGVVGRVARAGRTDLAARVVDAAARRGRRTASRLRAIGSGENFSPLCSAHALSICRLYESGIGRLRIRLGAAVFGIRARLAADVQPPFGVARNNARARSTRSASPSASPYIDFSRRSSSENRLHAPPQCSASPPTAIVIEMMPLGLLILDVVVVPRVLAVLHARGRDSGRGSARRRSIGRLRRR